jgi:hypothetical protein
MRTQKKDKKDARNDRQGTSFQQQKRRYVETTQFEYFRVLAGVNTNQFENTVFKNDAGRRDMPKGRF